MPQEQIFDIKVIKPSAILAPYVEYYWVIDSMGGCVNHTERVIPEGAIDLMFHYEETFKTIPSNGKAFYQPLIGLCGQKSVFSDVITQGKVGVIAVRFFPHTASNFFKLPLSELSNIYISLNDLIGNDSKEFEEKIFLANNLAHRIRIIEDFLMRSLTNKHQNQDRIKHAVDIITRNQGQVSVEDLANRTNMSLRNFSRCFSHIVGITPKQYQRIIRMNAVIKGTEDFYENNLTQIAYNSGFADQSHFIKEFQEMTGYTPKLFFKTFGEKC